MDASSYRFQPATQPYRRVGLLCFWLVVVASASALWLWRVPSVQVLSVQSGSMEPLIHRGDAVVVNPVPIADIHAGDIVSYHNPRDERMVITHRVQAISMQTGLVTTKGDNAVTADQPFAANLIVGRVQRHIIGLGRAIDVLHSTMGLMLVVYAPALIIVALELRRLMGYFQPTYRLYSRY
jgi:signal peptidase I